MCARTLVIHNTRIPTSALVDLTRPTREPVGATPIFEFSGGTNLVPVLCGDEAPIFLSPSDIVALGGKVPMPGDRLMGVEGRKVWIGSRVWMIRYDGGWKFDACNGDEEVAD